MSISPEQTREFFGRAVAQPLLRTFERDIQPRIREAFAGHGAAMSSRRSRAEATALEDLQSQMTAQLAQASRQDQQLRAQLEESAAQRQLQGLGIAQEVGPVGQLAQFLGLASPFQQHAQAQQQGRFQEFQRTLPQTNPMLQAALGFTGQSHGQVYMRQPRQLHPLAQQGMGMAAGAIGGGMGGAMLGAMGGSPFSSGQGAAMGALGGLLG